MVTSSYRDSAFLLFLSRALFVRAYYRRVMHVDIPVPLPTTTQDHTSDTPRGTQAPSPEPRTSIDSEIPTSAADRIRHRLEALHGTATQYRIRIHIAQVDPDGGEKDLGAWPDHVAQVSRVEDAMDLCTMITHHLRAFLFPKERAS
jgi:hypothetical protein